LVGFQGNAMTSDIRGNGASSLYRCAGPNCTQVKGSSDRWWVMWTSLEQYKTTVLYLAPWSEQLAQSEGALHVCGELCAQKLQSQFMGNVLASRKQNAGK
jgi:hypothetical protein